MEYESNRNIAYFFEAMDRGSEKLTRMMVTNIGFRLLSKGRLIPILDELKENGIIERIRDEFDKYERNTKEKITDFAGPHVINQLIDEGIIPKDNFNKLVELTKKNGSLSPSYEAQITITSYILNSPEIPRLDDFIQK